MKINKKDMSEINFTKLFLPISRISSIPVYMFNSLVKYVLPTITFIIVISIYFLYKNIYIGMIFIIGNLLILSYCFGACYFTMHNACINSYISITCDT